MATFKSQAATVAMTPAVLDEKFSDFSAMEQKLNELPADQRERVGDVKFEKDCIIITTPQVGAITLKASERKPGHVALTAENSPVPMTININYKAAGEGCSEVVGEMEVDIPMILKPVVGPALQKAVDQFGTLFTRLA